MFFSFLRSLSYRQRRIYNGVKGTAERQQWWWAENSLQYLKSSRHCSARHTVNRPSVPKKNKKKSERKEGKNIQVQWPQYVKLYCSFGLFCVRVAVYIDRVKQWIFTRNCERKWEHYNGVNCGIFRYMGEKWAYWGECWCRHSWMALRRSLSPCLRK